MKKIILIGLLFVFMISIVSAVQLSNLVGNIYTQSQYDTIDWTNKTNIDYGFDTCGASKKDGKATLYVCYYQPTKVYDENGSFTNLYNITYERYPITQPLKPFDDCKDNKYNWNYTRIQCRDWYADNYFKPIFQRNREKMINNLMSWKTQDDSITLEELGGIILD